MRMNRVGTTTWRWVVLALLCAGFALGALERAPRAAMAQSKGYAILVVGNTRNAVMTELENQAKELLKSMRDRLELDESALPVISYHFEKSDERAYCEDTLGIKSGHLLFVGLVEQNDLVVRKVLLPVNKVTDPKGAAIYVMSAAARKLGKDPTALRVQSTPPVPAVKLTLVSLETATREGRVTRSFSPTDVGVFFKARFRNDYPAAAHAHRLNVRIYGPDGRALALEAMGGPFTVNVGENLEGVNLVKRSDPDQADGYPIAKKYMGNHPGTYTVAIELDGIEAGRTRFEVAQPTTVTVAPTGSGTGLELVSAAVQDTDGNPRDRFSTSDRGVFLLVRFRNTTPERKHEHTIRVTCYDPSGRVYGKPLGGPYVVEVGQTLTQTRFPSSCDPNRNNGYLIAGKNMANNPGTYRFTVEVDGKVAKTLIFYVSR